MEKKLTWEEIEKQYDREWVQLVDFDWPEEEAYPRAGVVAAHARKRREFDALIAKTPQENSALLYVGKRELPPGVILNANLHQWHPSNA